MLDTGLRGRVALVTGANHGIGAATAVALAGQGAAVFLTYLRLTADPPTAPPVADAVPEATLASKTPASTLSDPVLYTAPPAASSPTARLPASATPTSSPANRAADGTSTRLSGTVTVPENAQSPPAAAGQPEPPAAALLPVRAAVDLAPGPYEIRVRARAMIDGKEFVTFASTRPAVSRDRRQDR